MWISYETFGSPGVSLVRSRVGEGGHRSTQPAASVPWREKGIRAVPTPPAFRSRRRRNNARRIYRCFGDLIRLPHPPKILSQSRNKLEEAFEGLPEDEPSAEDEVVVDKQDRDEDAKAQMEPPPPSYHAHQGAGAPPSHYGAPPPQFGAPPAHYGAAPPPQYYQPPPPPPQVYYVSGTPAVDTMTGLMAGMGMMAAGFAQTAQAQAPSQNHTRAPPPPYGETAADVSTPLGAVVSFWPAWSLA